MGLLLSLAAVLISAYVSLVIFEGVAHIEDEFAYTWQAAVLAGGRLTAPSPRDAQEFLIPFVVDHHGLRFSKYPIGWSAVLAVGVKLGLRAWVNPLLAGLGVWLTYQLGKRIFNARVGLLGALLTVTSPFFLMNSGSLLSHPLGLALSAGFVLGWFEAFTTPQSPKPWLAAAAAALALGWLAVSRPFTAAVIAMPFGLHGLYILWRGSPADRRRLIGFGILAGAVAGVHWLWQYAATGDPFQNTYTLWWPYDTIGFGPEVGATEGGHNLVKAYQNTYRSLWVGGYDIFGWWGWSYALLPFGFWAARRNWKAWLTGSLFFWLVAGYAAYWVGAYLYGPRYYYEGLFSLALLSAAGLDWLSGWGDVERGSKWQRWRRLLAAGGLSALVGINLLFFTPLRLGSMYRLFGIGRDNITQFLQAAETAQAETPALVFVDTPRWMTYAILTELQDPLLSTPFIFAWSSGPEKDRQTAAPYYPQRAVYYYYPDEPDTLYAAPRSAR